MNGRDIVMMSLQNWGESLGSNSYNLAIEFARNNRVLYINRAPDRKSQIKSILKGQKTDVSKEWITRPRENIFVLHTRTIVESINTLPVFAFQYMNRRNGKKLSEEISKAVDKLKFKSIILFIDNDFFRGQYLKEYLKPSLFIYYIRDNLRTHPYFKKHGQHCEDTIARKADIVFANSGYLADLIRPVNSNSHDIGQGCDFSLYPEKVVERPADLPPNNKPLVGYIGNIVSYRLDLEKLELICKQREDLNWVFIGPADEDFSNSSLQRLTNVFFTGIKKEGELWMYLQHIDVCINPQLVNGMTIGNYPRKIDEYLYAGKPVVATNTGFMKSFDKYVYLFENMNEFENKIELALLEISDTNKIEERKIFAASHSWSKCIKNIYSLTKNLNHD